MAYTTIYPAVLINCLEGDSSLLVGSSSRLYIHCSGQPANLRTQKYQKVNKTICRWDTFQVTDSIIAHVHTFMHLRVQFPFSLCSVCCPACSAFYHKVLVYVPGGATVIACITLAILVLYRHVLRKWLLRGRYVTVSESIKKLCFVK